MSTSFFETISGKTPGLKPIVSIAPYGAPEGAPFQSGFDLCCEFARHHTRTAAGRALLRMVRTQSVLLR
jgi:hypothetical protein